MSQTPELLSQSAEPSLAAERTPSLHAAREWICHKVGAFAARTAAALVLAAGAGAATGVATEMAEQPTPAAAAATRPCGDVMVAGSAWLGGFGVDARANGNLQGKTDSCGGQGPYGNQWQCLELVSHLLSARGWYNGLSGVGVAKNLYPYTAQGKYPGLVARQNGSGYRPVPGDIIVITNNYAGHVAVVDWYDDSILHAVEQNGDVNGRFDFNYNPNTGGISKGNLAILGYVHANANTFTNPSSGSGQVVSGNGQADFNGDGRSDLVVRNGVTWTVRSGSGAGIAEGLQLDNNSNARPLVGDVSGDGRSDFVTYSNGNWTAWSGAWPNLHVSQGVQLGGANSTPLVGDANGDGRDDFITFEGGQWNIKSGDGTPIALGVQRGPANATPLVDDLNGDGRDDLVTYDRGTWAAWNATGTNAPITQGLQFGGANATPMVGDVNGNGQADLIVREGNTWYVRDRFGNPIAQGVQRGTNTSTPFVSDISGDGKDDLTTFEPNSGAWLAWNGTGSNNPVSQGVNFGAGGVGLTG